MVYPLTGLQEINNSFVCFCGLEGVRPYITWTVQGGSGPEDVGDKGVRVPL